MKKIFISALVISALILTGCTNQETPETNLDNFAKCLTEKGAMIYTTKTCGYCQKQKSMFGDSRQYINDIDCYANPTKCSNIKSVPNWNIDGKDFLGLQSLEILAEKTGCEI